MESHSAPPGYNPNVSLLQGGTAPILPVQGGGGIGAPPTPDYNPSASLLEGGTGVIQAVRGGGPDDKVRFAEGEKIKEVRSFETEKNTRPAAKFYSVEQYRYTESSEPIPALESNKAKRRGLYMAISNAEGLVPLYKLTDTGPKKSFGMERGQYKECKKLSPGFFNRIARRVRISKQQNPFLWLAVNIEGDLKKFLAVKKLFDEANTPMRNPNHFLFFVGNFFGSAVKETNVVLYDEFMKLKLSYLPADQNSGRKGGQVFGLFHLDERFLNNSCVVLESLFEKTTIAQRQKVESKHLPSFNEPDIFVFPKRKLVLRNCSLPISSDDMGLHKYLTDTSVKENLKPDVFFLEQGDEEDRLPSYFDISYDPRKVQTKYPEEGDIQCKDAVCPNFVKGIALKKLHGHLNLTEAGLYLIYDNNNVKRLPFFREEGEEGEGEEEEEPAPVATEAVVEEDVVPPPPGPPAIPTKPRAQIERIEEPEKEEQPFKADPSAYVSKDSTEFQIEYEEFSLRNPTAENQVKEDWLKGVFTEGEVSLLNGLRLSPTILEDTFGETWKKELASFLESLTTSNCFKNTQYLLTSECDQARRFLRKAYYKIYVDVLNKLYTRWGLATPPPDSSELLTALLKEIGQLTIMLGKDREGMSAQTQNITHEDFLGDPSGRYLRIMVDLENEEQPFFANYAELNNASQQKLVNLEKQLMNIRKGIKTYKRITGKNLKNVLNAFKKTRKGKQPNTKSSGNTTTGNQTPETQTPETQTSENNNLGNMPLSSIQVDEEVENNNMPLSRINVEGLRNINVNRSSANWKKQYKKFKNTGLSSEKARNEADLAYRSSRKSKKNNKNKNNAGTNEAENRPIENNNLGNNPLSNINVEGLQANGNRTSNTNESNNLGNNPLANINVEGLQANGKNSNSNSNNMPLSAINVEGLQDTEYFSKNNPLFTGEKAKKKKNTLNATRKKGLSQYRSTKAKNLLRTTRKKKTKAKNNA
jgi:hypothetical protein